MDKGNTCISMGIIYKLLYLVEHFLKCHIELLKFFANVKNPICTQQTLSQLLKVCNFAMKSSDTFVFSKKWLIFDLDIVPGNCDCFRSVYSHRLALF